MRKRLEELRGHKVRVVLRDGTELAGVLHKMDCGKYAVIPYCDRGWESYGGQPGFVSGNVLSAAKLG